jgi:hypothetical protein
VAARLRTLSAHISFVFAVCIAPISWAESDAARLQARHRELADSYARASTGRPVPPTTGALLFIASDEYSPVKSENVNQADAGHKYGDDLFDLARQAAEIGQSSLAFQWATEVLREDPNHAEARRVLGYEQLGGHWLTAYGAKMQAAGKTWHPTFGWIAMADVARYEKGERLLNGRWVTAGADAARHSDIKHGWELRTDHFLVTTNKSLEAAADLAARLERLYQVWRELYAGFYLSEKEVRGLFASTSQPRAQARPFRVFFHRDRNQYNAALRARQPRIDETLGIYFDAFREAHFFAGDDVVAGGSPANSGVGLNSSTGGPPVATLYHEAVHQLFQESKLTGKHIGATANAWVIEGVATYFETLTEHTDASGGLYYTIGDATKGRLPAARQRLREGYYIPLADLVRLGKDELQRPENIAKRYSQSCGLAAFLLDGEQGRYREPLVRYLQAVYAGRDTERTLAEVTGKSYSELDAAYRRYMESLPQAAISVKVNERNR